MNRAVFSLLRQLLLTANVAPSSQILSTLMMQAMVSSETAVHTRATRCHIQENDILQIKEII
jgi:pyridoxine 5'-phosphate synthase PdxJ